MDSDKKLATVSTEFVGEIQSMVREQATSDFNKGDVYRVVIEMDANLDPIEMKFDRRDGVVDRRTAIDYVRNHLPVDMNNCKIEVFKE